MFFDLGLPIVGIWPSGIEGQYRFVDYYPISWLVNNCGNHRLLDDFRGSEIDLKLSTPEADRRIATRGLCSSWSRARRPG
mmetsp:Transcript_53299/g.61091  ORF Transcript_53299/g.61091 Transcript_53299/m.61091 type:complete len:80 (+) Transcript_53299:988-1227(+)